MIKKIIILLFLSLIFSACQKTQDNNNDMQDMKSGESSSVVEIGGGC